MALVDWLFGAQTLAKEAQTKEVRGPSGLSLHLDVIHVPWHYDDVCT